MTTKLESYKFVRPAELSGLDSASQPLLSSGDSNDPPPPLPPWPPAGMVQAASKAASVAPTDEFKPRRLSALFAARRALADDGACFPLPPPSVAPSDGRPLPPQEPFPYVLPEIQTGPLSLHQSDKALIRLLDHPEVLKHLSILIHHMLDKEWSPSSYSTSKHKGTSKDILQTIGDLIAVHSKSKEKDDFIRDFTLACTEKREPATCFGLLKQLAPRKNRYPEHTSFEELIYNRFCKRNRFSKDRIDIGLLTYYFNAEEDRFFHEPTPFPAFTSQTIGEDDDSSVYDAICANGQVTFRPRNASISRPTLRLPSVPKMPEADQIDLMDPPFARLRKAVSFYGEIQPIVSLLCQPGAISAAKTTVHHPAIRTLLFTPELQTNPVVQYLVVLANKDQAAAAASENPNTPEDLRKALETVKESPDFQSDPVAQFLLALANKSHVITRTAQAAIIAGNVRTIMNVDGSLSLLEYREDLLNDPLVQRLIANLAERIRAPNGASSAAAAALPASVMDLTLALPEANGSEVSEKDAPNLLAGNLSPEPKPEEEKRDEDRDSLLGSEHPTMRRRFSLQRSDDGMSYRPGVEPMYASPRSVVSNGFALRQTLRTARATYPELPEARLLKFSLHPSEKAFTNLLDNPDTYRLVNKLQKDYRRTEELSGLNLQQREVVYRRIRLFLKIYEKKSVINSFLNHLEIFCNHRNMNPSDILEILSLLSERAVVHRVDTEDKEGWKHFIKKYFCGYGDRINLSLLRKAFTPLEPVRKEQSQPIDETGSVVTLKARPARAGSLTQLFRSPSAEFNGASIHLPYAPASSAAAAAQSGRRGRAISQANLATIQRIVEEGVRPTGRSSED